MKTEPKTIVGVVQENGHEVTCMIEPLRGHKNGHRRMQFRCMMCHGVIDNKKLHPAEVPVLMGSNAVIWKICHRCHHRAREA